MTMLMMVHMGTTMATMIRELSRYLKKGIRVTA